MLQNLLQIMLLLLIVLQILMVIQMLFKSRKEYKLTVEFYEGMKKDREELQAQCKDQLAQLAPSEGDGKSAQVDCKK